jgi:hypothetical protein
MPVMRCSFQGAIDAGVAAGGDLITSQSLPDAAEMDSAILARVTADAAFRALVNSAVIRILRAKQAYHLLPCPRR